MANNGGEWFLLTTKFYKSSNDTALLASEKWDPEGKASVNSEGAAVKKQENMTTKLLVMWKIHANEIHVKLGHPREDRMCATAKHLHNNVEGAIEVFDDFATAKMKHKLLQTMVEERDPNLGKIIYLDLSSQKKLIYGGSKNWIPIQDSDEKQKSYFFMKAK